MGENHWPLTMPAKKDLDGSISDNSLTIRKRFFKFSFKSFSPAETAAGGICRISLSYMV